MSIQPNLPNKNITYQQNQIPQQQNTSFAKELESQFKSISADFNTRVANIDQTTQKLNQLNSLIKHTIQQKNTTDFDALKNRLYAAIQTLISELKEKKLKNADCILNTILDELDHQIFNKEINYIKKEIKKRLNNKNMGHNIL